MDTEGAILLTCSSKDNSLILAKMDNGYSTQIKLPTNLGIEYGCGIGPKVVISSSLDGVMAIVNQRADNQEFSLYELVLKW